MRLVLFNVVGLVLVWGIIICLFMLLGPAATAIVLSLMFVFAGLLVTMVFWHRGYLRAYAIGALTVLFFALNSGASVWIVYGAAFGGRGSGSPALLMGIAFTLIVLTGILCAGYVKLLELFGAKREEG